MDDLKRFFSLGHVADHVRGVTLKGGGGGEGRKLVRTDDSGYIAKEVVPPNVWATREETRREVDRLDEKIDHNKDVIEAELIIAKSELRGEIATTKETLEDEIERSADCVEEAVKEWSRDKFAPKTVRIPDGDSNDSNDQWVELSELAVLTFNTTQNHLADFDNPHQVTKVQVGLGNVDNTSDMDKPVSTATREAIDEVAKKVSKVYRYMGSVEDYSDLPVSGNEGGDVYNVKSDGMNVAWVEEGSNDEGYWDDLGPSLAGYLTEEKAEATYLSKTDAESHYASKSEIPKKVSDLDNDAGYITSEAEFNAWKNESSVVAGNRSSAGLTSVAIGNRATASGQKSIAISSSDDANSTAASGLKSIAVGFYAKASGSETIAIGNRAQASAAGAIQLGYGTNDESNTLKVGNYKLLDAEGYIPPERIKSYGQSDSIVASNGNRATIGADGNLTITVDDGGVSVVKTVATVEQIPPEQVQSDWDQTDSASKDFIKNKPTIPPPQVQADWDEDDPNDVSFIRNKPEITNSLVSPNGRHEATVDDNGVIQVESQQPIDPNDEIEVMRTALGLQEGATFADIRSALGLQEGATLADARAAMGGGGQSTVRNVAFVDQIPDMSDYRTASAQDAIDGAQDTAIAAKYTKPDGGIPASDLAPGVIPTAPVTSVNEKTGAVVLSARDIGDGSGGTVLGGLQRLDLTKANAVSLAPAFSPSSTYAVGDYVTYEGLLYKCTTAVTTAGAWTGSANWTVVTATDGLYGLHLNSNGYDRHVVIDGTEPMDIVATESHVSVESLEAAILSGGGYDIVFKTKSLATIGSEARDVLAGGPTGSAYSADFSFLPKTASTDTSIQASSSRVWTGVGRGTAFLGPIDTGPTEFVGKYLFVYTDGSSLSVSNSNEGGSMLYTSTIGTRTVSGESVTTTHIVAYKDYVDSQIGSIASVLDAINGEVI